jgi:hypothetical protein
MLDPDPDSYSETIADQKHSLQPTDVITTNKNIKNTCNIFRQIIEFPEKRGLAVPYIF